MFWHPFFLLCFLFCVKSIIFRLCSILIKNLLLSLLEYLTENCVPWRWRCGQFDSKFYGSDSKFSYFRSQFSHIYTLIVRWPLNIGVAANKNRKSLLSCMFLTPFLFLMIWSCVNQNHYRQKRVQTVTYFDEIKYNRLNEVKILVTFFFKSKDITQKCTGKQIWISHDKSVICID